MNIYFDFEATQFSERVLAIGASCEYGDFECLVKPCKGDKLTAFITNLTGITKEMLIGAPDAETAFADLYDWMAVMTQEADTPIFYHCFGDSDPLFLKHTANRMKNGPTKDFVLDLADSMLDDSYNVKKFFHSKAIGLHKALKYFEPELPDQKHDPLDDALMLRRLMETLENAEPLTECPYEECSGEPAAAGKKKKKKAVVVKDTRRYTILITHLTDKNAKPKQFKTVEAAINWAFHKITKNNPPANLDSARATVQKHTQRAIDTEGNYLGWHWNKEYLEN